MKYLSSRGVESGLTFEKVLFSGYAADGGLYFPESIPQIDELEAWACLSYPEMVKKMLRIFIDESEIPSNELLAIVDQAFEKFQIPEIVTVSTLKDGLNVAELFHGPTLAFKDLALSVVGGLYNYFLKKSGKNCIILIGTSGDTGSAAISAVRGLTQIDIIVLLPKDRCTKIQQLQMTTVHDDNVHNFVVDGTSDDLDVLIKKVFEDADFVKKYNLCSINSINWARILIQVVHYIYCYFKCRTSPDQKVRFIVPTGACGNIAAGYLAHQMGVPIELVAVVNPNDIVRRTFINGEFQINAQVKPTWASAMDIQVPYNVERILLMASNYDFNRVREIMNTFEASGGKAKIPDDILKATQKVVVDSASVDDAEIEATILKCSQENTGYILCPHTAVAVKYFYEEIKPREREFSICCLATASPAKFPEAIKKSGLIMANPKGIQDLFALEEKFSHMKLGQNWEQILRDKIVSVYKR